MRGRRPVPGIEEHFERRTAVVTGGGSGIGAALVRALVARGTVVTVADLDGAAATRVAEQAGGPGSARAAELDVTDAAAVQSIVDDVVDQHGRLDLIFNNAGITFGGETEDLTLDDWTPSSTSTSAAWCTESRPPIR